MYTLLILAYVALLAYITIKTKKVAGTKDYLVADKDLTAWQVAMSIVADVNGATSILFMFGIIAMLGSASVGLYLVFFLTTFLMGYMALRFYDTAHQDNVVILTLSDFYKNRFGTYTEKAYSIVSILFSLSAVIAAYTVSITLFEHFLDVNKYVAVAISFGITLAYVLFGGFRLLVKTDILQTILMVLVFVGIALTVPFDIPYGEILDTSTWFSGAFWMFAPVLLFQNLAKPATWQPILGAKDAETAKRGFFYATGIFMILVIPIIIASFALKGAFGDMPPMDTLLNVIALYPSFVAPLAFVALLAAFMSTVDTMIFYSATNLARNLLPAKIFGFNTSDLTVVRWIMIIVSAATVALAMFVPSFITFLLAVVPLIGVVSIPLLFGLFYKMPALDRHMAFSIFIGVAVFIYQIMNPVANYFWNILPVVATAIMFCIMVAIHRLTNSNSK